MRRRIFRLFIPLLAAGAACARTTAKSAASPPAARSPEEIRAARVAALIEPLRALNEKPAPPGRRDWLAMHDEPGQTFEQYRRAGPVTPDATRKILYVQPLGRFTAGQRELVDKAADFLGRAYAVEVRVRPGKAIDDIPPLYRRTLGDGSEQILTKYLLEIVLMRDLPPDAVAMIAFTATDLWPGAGWNFVFGEARLRERVGVWSLARLGEPDGSEAEFKAALLRTLKISAHETGHMFTINHCTAYRCVMAGNNGPDELDRTPLRFCPEEFAKLQWATGGDPRERLTRLAEFCAREGLLEEALFFERSRRALAAALSPV